MGSVFGLSSQASPGADAQVVEWAHYTAFGEATLRSPDGNVLQDTQWGNAFGFQGHRQDHRIGLVDMRARHYRPSLGRFLRRDPIGLAGGNNQLAFVGSAPLKYTDPSGLQGKHAEWFRNNVNENFLAMSRWAKKQGLPSWIAQSVLPPGYSVGMPSATAFEDAMGLTGEALYEMGEGTVYAIEDNIEAFKRGGQPEMITNWVKNSYEGGKAAAGIIAHGSDRDRAKLGIQAFASLLLARAGAFAKGKVTSAVKGGATINVNRPGGGPNCGNCAIATDATIAGRPASALPSTKGMYLSTLARHFGTRWGRHTTIGSISRQLQVAGPGTRGIVFGSRGAGKLGHYFNAVVNKRGVVKFVDGQSGTAANLDGFVGFRFLPTN